jgi:hypothetical protein
MWGRTTGADDVMGVYRRVYEGQTISYYKIENSIKRRNEALNKQGVSPIRFISLYTNILLLVKTK